MSLPKIVFIDWNKTLSNSLFWEQLANSKHKYNSHHSKLIKWLFVDNKNIINPWMRGEHTSENISEMISNAINLDPSILLEELAISCKNMKFVSDEIPELINKIRSKGSKVIIATDNMDTFRKFTIKGMNLDELFDDYLISSEIGKLKGDFGKNGELLFFNKYMKDSDLKYEDTILLDDCIDETGTMDKAGLKIIQVTSPQVLIDALKAYAS